MHRASAWVQPTEATRVFRVFKNTLYVHPSNALCLKKHDNRDYKGKLKIVLEREGNHPLQLPQHFFMFLHKLTTLPSVHMLCSFSFIRINFGYYCCNHKNLNTSCLCCRSLRVPLLLSFEHTYIRYFLLETS